MTFIRLAPGLYESEDGRLTIERDDEGHWGPRSDWWIHIEYRNIVGPYFTLREAKAAAQTI